MIHFSGETKGTQSDREDDDFGDMLGEVAAEDEENTAAEKARLGAEKTEAKRNELQQKLDEKNIQLAGVKERAVQANQAVDRGKDILAKYLSENGGTAVVDEKHEKINKFIAAAWNANDKLQACETEVQSIADELANLDTPPTDSVEDVVASENVEKDVGVEEQAEPTPPTNIETPTAPALEAIQDQNGTTKEIVETSPEDSAEALQKIYKNFITANGVLSNIKERDFPSVEDMMDTAGKRTQSNQELIQSLETFQNKGSDSLTQQQREQLTELLAKANGETHYAFPHGPKGYDWSGPTTLHNQIKDIRYFMDNDAPNLTNLEEKMVVLNGGPIPENDFDDRRYGSLKTFAEYSAKLTPEDRHTLSNFLSESINNGTKGQKMAGSMLETKKRELDRSEPAMRNAEEKLHNTRLKLRTLQTSLTKKFSL